MRNIFVTIFLTCIIAQEVDKPKNLKSSDTQASNNAGEKSKNLESSNNQESNNVPLNEDYSYGTSVYNYIFGQETRNTNIAIIKFIFILGMILQMFSLSTKS